MSEEVWLRAREEIREQKGGVAKLEEAKGCKAEDLLGYSYVVSLYE